MKITLTKTVRRNAVLIASIFIIFLLVFNLILYYVINYQLTDVLDSKIRHEMEHVWSAFEIKNNKVNIIRASEFQESDLVKMSDNPFFLQIYSSTGQVLFASENIKYFNTIPLVYPSFDSPEYFTNTITENEEIRTGYKKIFNEAGRHIGFFQLSARRLRLEEALTKILIYNLLLLPFILVIIVFISIFISKKTIKPIRSIIDTADRISAVNLKERLQFDTDPDDEMSKLKSTLNNLFDRLEIQIQQIASFSDNASHQLMTPLTTINAELDFVIKKEALNIDTRQSLLIIKEQSDQIIGIIKSLLIMARAGKDSFDSNLIFSVNSVIEKSIKPFFPQANIQYDIKEEIYLRGRGENFTIVLQNLLDNAIKYSSADSKITFASNLVNNNAEITISDNGLGIPSQEKERVFERFYRSKRADELGIKGYGLGLSLVKAIVLSMNGKIELKDNETRGTKVILTFPIVRLE